MAMDQALLETVGTPVLRLYRWSEPSVSFGYSQSLAAVQAGYPAFPLVRRWTGGGVVEHTGDWTFGLVCPMAEPFAQLPPNDTYRLIHSTLVEALQCEGITARLVAPHESLSGPACFTAPALHDVFNEFGTKICGGAQRRTRHGFLHQGSLQKTLVGDDLAQRFATVLAASVSLFSSSPELERRAGELAKGRYAADAWLGKIP